MKNIIKLSAILLVFVFASCKDNKKDSDKEEVTTESTQSDNDQQLYSCSMHPEVHGKKGEACPVCGMELTEPVAQAVTAAEEVPAAAEPLSKSSFSIDGILNNYLKLKNALANDDSKEAAEAAKELSATLSNLKSGEIEAKFKKEYTDVTEDAKEQAQHIGDNSAKIGSQREHFAMLSKDVNNLIKIFGTDKKIYRDYCPMYDQGKSGYWISETKEIKNPYYGSEMLTCGGITNEW
jgi:DNA repair exonuclease SbcCD ATPase subunit